MSNLAHLDIQESDVEQFGLDGMFDCTSLEKLIMLECAVTGISEEDRPVYQKYKGDGCFLDESFAENFQCLDRLEMMIGCGEVNNGMMNYDWLFRLTSLTKLSLTMLANANLDDLSSLSRLCELSIDGYHYEDANKVLELGMRWGHMQCLQSLNIVGLINMHIDILGLLSVDCLK